MQRLKLSRIPPSNNCDTPAEGHYVFVLRTGNDDWHAALRRPLKTILLPPETKITGSGLVYCIKQRRDKIAHSPTVVQCVRIITLSSTFTLNLVFACRGRRDFYGAFLSPAISSQSNSSSIR